MAVKHSNRRKGHEQVMKKEKQVRGPRAKVRLDGAALEAARIEKNWTIEDLAAASEVSESTIKRAISKRGGEISRHSADQITYALGLELRDTQLAKAIAIQDEELSRILKERSIAAPSGVIQPTYATHTDKYLENRYVEMYQMAEAFVAHYEDESSLEIELSPVLLYEIVREAYDRIAQKKSYHLEPTNQASDRNQGAAIIAVSISRHRPIWVRPSSAEETIAMGQNYQDCMLINDNFAINFALAFAQIEPANLSSQTILDLVWFLKMSNDPNALALMLKQLPREKIEAVIAQT